jgi:hypothetical protein
MQRCHGSDCMYIYIYIYIYIYRKHNKSLAHVMSTTQNKQSIPTTVGSGASSPYVVTTITKGKGPNLAI